MRPHPCFLKRTTRQIGKGSRTFPDLTIIAVMPVIWCALRAEIAIELRASGESILNFLARRARRSTHAPRLAELTAACFRSLFASFALAISLTAATANGRVVPGSEPAPATEAAPLLAENETADSAESWPIRSRPMLRRDVVAQP